MHVVGGEKGGVGRSVVARLLAQFFIDRVVPWVGFDGSRRHGAFARCYSDYVQPLDLDRDADLDRAVEALEEGADEVVVDLPGRSEDRFADWLASGQVPDLLEQLQHPLWYWYVIDDSRDSVLLLQSFLDELRPRLGAGSRVVCVPNHGRALDFRLFDESKLGSRIEQDGGVVLELPELHAESMAKMEAFDKSFWAAIHNADPDQGPCLSLMQRQRAKVFIRRVHASLRELLFESSGEPDAAES